MIIKQPYRPDLDGLRAIAVLAVLLFHFGVPPFTGGFVGVDVFFVISGYLITKIILGEAEAGTFSWGAFYTRRARRLLPALLTTIAMSYVTGVVFFSAQDLIQLSRSTIAAILSVSNISFWLQANYFDTEAIYKPLLHTWSLAVEFQFYLVWPALLLVLSRTGSRCVILAGIILAASASFIGSLLMLQKDPSGAFYLTPFRIHEFALGGMVVFLEERKLPRWLAEMLFPVGLAAVLAGVFAFNEQTQFPGYAALVPSLGAAAMIYAGSSARLAWPLRTAPMRAIGLMSYSLYLVHWPLLVFVHYATGRDLTGIEIAGLIATTFILAFVSYRFVETVFRRPGGSRLVSPVAFNLACVAMSALIIIPAAASWVGKGWVWRMPREIRHINRVDIKEANKYLFEKYTTVKDRPFTTDKKHIYVIGDSQAADLVNMLFEADQGRELEIASGSIITECGIPYISGRDEEKFWTVENPRTVKDPSIIADCKSRMERAINSPALRQADAVVLAMLWRPEGVKHLSDAAAAFQSRTKAPIYVLGRKDLALGSVDIVNKYGRLNGIEGYASKNTAPLTRKLNATLLEMFGDRYVDMMEIVCPSKDRCHVLTDALKPIFYNRSHLTKEGASFMGRLLMQSQPAFLR